MTSAQHLELLRRHELVVVKQWETPPLLFPLLGPSTRAPKSSSAGEVRTHHTEESEVGAEEGDGIWPGSSWLSIVFSQVGGAVSVPGERRLVQAVRPSLSAIFLQQKDFVPLLVRHSSWDREGKQILRLSFPEWPSQFPFSSWHRTGWGGSTKDVPFHSATFYTRAPHLLEPDCGSGL